MTKKLIIFDLDGTLAKSKCPLESDMANAIIELLRDRRTRAVAIISGCSYNQMESQFLTEVKNAAITWSAFGGSRQGIFEDMFLLPTCGSQLYEAPGGWGYKRLYHNNLKFEEKVAIYNAWKNAIEAHGIKTEEPFGEIAEDRESQITFSMRGQQAPIEVKEKWDPKQVKRKKIVTHMKPNLSNFEVRIGGSTSIDVTQKGVDKAYGIQKLMEFLNNGDEIVKKDIIFIGDALFEGGNDYPAKEMGLECIETSGPEETLEIIKKLYE